MVNNGLGSVIFLCSVHCRLTLFTSGFVFPCLSCCYEFGFLVHACLLWSIPSEISCMRDFVNQIFVREMKVNFDRFDILYSSMNGTCREWIAEKSLLIVSNLVSSDQFMGYYGSLSSGHPSIFLLGWRAGSIGRVSDSRSEDPRFKPHQEQAQEKYDFFFYSQQCLCWLAVFEPNPLCVYAHIRMITYAH